MTSFPFLTVIVAALPAAWCVIGPQVEPTSTLDFTAVEGRTAILPCSIRDLGRHKVKVAWADPFSTTLTLIDSRIIDDNRFSVSTNHKNEWNLRIEKVKLSDSGMYVCTVNTAPPIRHEVTLTVVVPPRITRPSKDREVNVPEFERVTLTCEAEGLPKPNITWTRMAPVDSESRSCEHQHTDMAIGRGEVLIIHNASRECGGRYYCEAENTVYPSARRTFDVKVQFAPQIHLANRRLGQVLGKDTVLECIISGRPTSQVYWVFNGRQLDKATYEKKKYQVDVFDSDEGKVTMLLIINNIERNDLGNYKCVGKNNMGIAEKTMELYEHKIRTADSETTTTTSTTRRPRSMIAAGNYGPHTTMDRSKHVRPPKGREGVGYNRDDVIDTGYPGAASSQREGKNSSPGLAVWSCHVITLSLVLVHEQFQGV